MSLYSGAFGERERERKREREGAKFCQPVCGCVRETVCECLMACVCLCIRERGRE